MKHLAIAVSLVLSSAGAFAQLSSPLPAGTGPGVHGANSPFAQLQERGDIVPWSLLTDVKTRTDKNKVFPVFAVGRWP